MPELNDQDLKSLERFNREIHPMDWVMPPVSKDDLAGGVVLSKTHVKQGQSSGEWRNHPRYPTIACRALEPDWSTCGALKFWAYSEVPTNEVITFGVCSDNPATPALDYFTHDFTVDWTGWKEINLPFSEFHSLGKPMGWNHVDGLYFFTKFARRAPDPRTALFLDDMKLTPGKAGAVTAAASPAPSAAEAGDIFFSIAYSHDKPVDLNHKLPELSADAKPTQGPFVQKAFFRGVRANDAYFPKFDPGYVYFDPKGCVYLRSQGLDEIETLDDSGKWQRHDLMPSLKAFAKERGWEGISVAWGGDPTIRFDNDGDIYALVAVRRSDRNGKETDAKDRTALLLHSRDQAKTWTVQALPGRMADFEKLDGHNDDCLKYPPIVILSDFKYFQWAEQDGFLVAPEKNPDGTLTLPPKVQFSHNGCAVTGPVHSGAGNFALSHGDQVFVVYGLTPISTMTAGNANPAIVKDTVADWEKALPAIPAGHPARQMTYVSADGKKQINASDGVPTYIVAYDRKTRKVSDPVFLGYGGRARDGHNWAAISADSTGILHVVINGHIDPLFYTHSLQPYDISAWSKPEYIPREPGSQAYSYVSYASLNCDKHDNLLCVVRSDTGGSSGYNHRLAVLRKPTGQPWAKEQSIVVPFEGGYHVWTDKVTYDKVHDRYFIGYYDQSTQIQFNRLSYQFYRFYWPDIEPDMTVGKQGLNPGLPKGKESPIYTPGPCEFTDLLSSDGGQTWRLATTPDFQP